MKVLRIASLLTFALAFSGLAIAADEAKSAPKQIPDFDVQGISMTECQCTAYGCPCRSNGHPDHGSCDAADFTYIKHGHYGKVDMSGFKAVLVGDLIDPDPPQPGEAVVRGVDVGPHPGDDRPDCAPGDPHQLRDRGL